MEREGREGWAADVERERMRNLGAKMGGGCESERIEEGRGRGEGRGVWRLEQECEAGREGKIQREKMEVRREAARRYI